jgi:hypothetical protein
MNEASTQDDNANEQKTTGPQSVPVSISKLRAAYNDAGGQITQVAQHYDASYSAVRRWLISAGIHTPDTREDYSKAAVLEEVDPDAVTRDGRDGGRSA